ncbi:MAG: hypothetical protein WC702_01780 [Patescibacteria group bacterium]|jgi:hypothetical protein
MSTSQGTFTPPRRAAHTTETRTIVGLSIDKAAKSFKAAVFAKKGDDPVKRLATIRERAIALLNCHTLGDDPKSSEILRKAGRLAKKNSLPDDIVDMFPVSAN